MHATLKKHCLFALLPVLMLTQLLAQQNKEPLAQQLKRAKQDTTEISLLNAAAKALSAENPDSALALGGEALRMSTRLRWDKGIVTSNLQMASACFNKSEFDTALVYYNCALAGSAAYPSQVKQIYSGIGNTYLYKGDYTRSLDFLFKALKAAEQDNDKSHIALCYMNIANVFIMQNESQKALDYNLKALAIIETLNDQALKEKACYTIGNCYGSMRRDEEALAWFSKSLELNKKMSNKSGMAYAYSAIGSCSENLGRHDEALENFRRSSEIAAAIGDKRVQVGNISTMAFVYKTTKQYPKAIESYKKTISLCEEIGASDIELEALGELTEVYRKTNNDHEALASYERYIALRDTMMSQEKAKEIVRKEMSYEFDKKQAAAKAEKEKIQLRADADRHRQNLVVLVVLIVLVIVSVFSVLIYRSLRISRHKSRIIEQQKLLVESQHDEIQEKQKEILDSINYARRIQQALLPPLHEVKAALPESFILFKPKDIVSGDFYWFADTREQVLIAAADCTGHGVPGAFMSTIGTEKLNEAVKDSDHPGTVLNLVNQGLKKVLRQNSGKDATRDGMDIALCAFGKGSRHLSYAGANRPIWIIRKDAPALEEIKATKASIGGFTEDEQLFETHTIALETGDCIYIFSDGFADQFGQSNKKLMTKKFKEVLMSVSSQPMDMQRDFLNRFIDDWKSGVEQTDDIIVIGIRQT